jgi:hypothetical protein
MEHVGLLPSSQEPATRPGSETGESNPYPHILFIEYLFDFLTEATSFQCRAFIYISVVTKWCSYIPQSL